MVSPNTFKRLHDFSHGVLDHVKSYYNSSLWQSDSKGTSVLSTPIVAEKPVNGIHGGGFPDQLKEAETLRPSSDTETEMPEMSEVSPSLQNGNKEQSKQHLVQFAAAWFTLSPTKDPVCRVPFAHKSLLFAPNTSQHNLIRTQPWTESLGLLPLGNSSNKTSLIKMDTSKDIMPDFSSKRQSVKVLVGRTVSRPSAQTSKKAEKARTNH